MRHARRIGFILAVTVLIMGSLSCSASYTPHSAFVKPSLIITGDVQNELILTDFSHYIEIKTTYNDEPASAISLLSVLKDAVPAGKDISLFFVSPDGAMAQIPYCEIDKDSLLLLTDENGWQFYSQKHPKQSRIRNMDKIVVCAKEPIAGQKCFSMIYGEQSLTFTLGELFTENAFLQSVFEGQAKMDEWTTNVYAKRALIPLAQYAKRLDAENFSGAAAYFGDGSQYIIELDGYLEWRGNSLDYLASDKKSRKKDIIGVWIDAPKGSVTDIASFALERLNDGNVLIILLDGAGYYNLLEHSPEFLNSQDITPIRTVMPSISNVALAAIVTGETPAVNGVKERKDRSLLADDIFKTAADLGYKCGVAEGSTRLISLSIEQTLNTDTDGDGYTDSEVQKSAFNMINEGAKLLFVHFHGFDDAAHTFGPSSSKAAAKLYELDEYVLALCSAFNGTVIITADHGQHSTIGEDRAGGHGEFLPRDMTVPLIIIEAE
ncbi:MAG: alkaline phosphatase family protein [Christensenellales bacterium]